MPVRAHKMNHVNAFLLQIKERSDKLMNYFLIAFFAGGLLLSVFYDTWEVAIGVGSLSLLAYYSVKYLLPDSNLYQYVLSTVFAIFMAQYIYQMHGLFEMHFIAFVGSTILVTYQNWKLQIPIALVVVIHHALFGYLQYLGHEEIYFTQLEYMDLQTFIIHGILAGIIFFICGLWAHQLKKYSERHIEQTFEMGRIEEEKNKQEELFQMSENLKAANAQLVEAQQIASIGSWVWDIKNNEVQRSEEFFNIIERKPSEFANTPEAFFDCIHPEDIEQVKKIVSESKAELKPFEYEARIFMPDLSIKNIVAKGQASESSTGDIVKMHGTIQDITERKKHEQVIEESNKELRKSNHELDKFVYSVSHDLRAPLSSMLGVVTLIETETTDNSIAGDIKMLKNSIHKLDGFIKDILDYSRNARTDVNLQEIHFDELLNDIKGNLKHMASANANVDMRIHVKNGTSFLSDRVRLNIILNNLISNSIRYSKPDISDSFVEVHVDANETDARIVIKDNGIGIAKENQDKVFDMFYRISKKSVGSGLGLYIVKEMVEKLNGYLHLESQIDEGTQFTILIPNMHNIILND